MLAFLLELAALAAFVYWGVATGQGAAAKIALGVGAPLVAIAVWSLFGAPRAKWRLRGPWRAFLHVIFFGGAAAALFIAGQHTLAVLFALLYLLNGSLIYAFG